MSAHFPNSFANENLSTMYLDSELADVHFAFSNDDQSTSTFAAHKLILASASPVFKTMFYGPMKEADTVKITDFSADAFKEFLQIFYLPEIKLTIKTMDDVVRLADKYDILDRFPIEPYQKFIENNLTNESMVYGYQLAISLDDPEMKKFCERRIRIFTRNVLKSEAFLNCKREVVEHILQLDVLECSEIDLLDACVAWAKLACQKNGLDETNSKNLKNQLGPCFYLIRFGAMKADDIANILMNKIVEGLFTSEELAELWRLIMKKQSTSNVFNHLPRLWLWQTLLDANLLICTRLRLDSLSLPCKTESQESTLFTSSEFIVLKRIHFGSVYLNRNGSYSDAKLTANLNIFEYHEDDSHDILATRTCKIGDNCTCDFYLPIVINPSKRYEIRLDFPNSIVGYYHKSTYCTHAQLDEKTRIEFSYRAEDVNRLRRGMVSKFDFYRIE